MTVTATCPDEARSIAVRMIAEEALRFRAEFIGYRFDCPPALQPAEGAQTKARFRRFLKTIRRITTIQACRDCKCNPNFPSRSTHRRGGCASVSGRRGKGPGDGKFYCERQACLEIIRVEVTKVALATPSFKFSNDQPL